MELLDGHWYSANLRAIRELVEDPTHAEPRPGDTMEVVIQSVDVHPNWWAAAPERANSPMASEPSAAFVRLSIDDQPVGETSALVAPAHAWSGNFEWNERILCSFRAAERIRFELCSGGRFPCVRGSCAMGAESLTKFVLTHGRMPISNDILFNGDASKKIGVIHATVGLWDGRPLRRGGLVRPAPERSHEEVYRWQQPPSAMGNYQMVPTRDLPWCSQALPSEMPRQEVPMQAMIAGAQGGYGLHGRPMISPVPSNLA